MFFGFALGQQTEVTSLSAHEEHRGAVWAGGGACAATDAGSGVHRKIGDSFRNRKCIRVRGGSAALGDKSARLDNTIECASVDSEITQSPETAPLEMVPP